MPPQLEPDSSQRHNLAWPFHQRAREQPARPALWVDGTLLTYGELAERAARIAAWLRARDIGPGGRVGILGNRSLLVYAGVLGTGWAGATYVPLHPKNPAARLGELIRRARIDALIADAAGVAALAASLEVDLPEHLLLASGADARRGTLASSLGDLAPLAEPVAMRPDDLAYLMFTSGTTGAPKGVMVTCSNVAHFLEVVRRRYRLGPADRVSQFFELTFDLSVFDLFATWDAGACLYALPEVERMSPLGFVRAHELTVWFGVPSTISFLLRVKALAPRSLPSLRWSLFCGEPLPAESAERWREAASEGALENLYGPTEATVACLAEPCTDRIVVTPGRDIVAIGEPFPGIEAAVVDAQLRPLPDGEEGELVLAGPQVAAGYWDEPGLTAERFVELELPRAGRCRAYRTNDLARRAGDGRFHFLGRLDNQVKIRGHRVELEEIDAHLRAAARADAAALAWPLDHGSADGVVAFVTGTAPDEAIARELRERLPWYMLPKRIVRLAELPLTSNGKVDRGALRKLLGP